MDDLFWSCRPKCFGVGLYSNSKGFINFLCGRLIDREENPEKYKGRWENDMKRVRIAVDNDSQPVATVDCKAFIGYSSGGHLDCMLIYFIFAW